MIRDLIQRTNPIPLTIATITYEITLLQVSHESVNNNSYKK